MSNQLARIEYTKRFTSGLLCGLRVTNEITIDKRFIGEWYDGCEGVDMTGNGYTLEDVRIVG